MKFRTPNIAGDCRLRLDNKIVGFNLTFSYKYVSQGMSYVVPGLNLGLRPANERRRYFVTTSLIGWAQSVESALWFPMPEPTWINEYGAGT